MTAKEPKADPFLTELTQAISDTLKKPKLSNKDRIAAIAAGTKLLAIKHKLLEGDDDGSYFGKS